MLIAATGVGAGDLITASLAGSQVGLVIGWAVLVGALLKWTLNEGLARWQMVTGTTLLEGWHARLGRGVEWIFLIYLLAWAFFTGGALISACGAAGAALCDLGQPMATAKSIWGIFHSLLGAALVWFGGFRVFERLMSVCIALMFCTVILTAILIRPDWSAVLQGLVRPAIPAQSTTWVLGLLGGVGGSVTLLSYGYWIREEGRSGIEGVRQCRIDLAVGYTMTALFGVAMVTIGSRLTLTKGASDRVAAALAEQLATALGPAGKWIFLIGFWGAVFSSLLGVWQSVPYLFADFVLLRGRAPGASRPQVDFTRTAPYRVFLIALAVLPMVLLHWGLQRVQLAYAVMAALFMPFLAATLLIMNNHKRWIDRRFRTPWLMNILLAGTLLFFAWTGVRKMFASP
ncbi:MAG: Nramp family divalent metal transporter [Phycisphaerales bacterium]|nr:Nramp family divalent metal transporter [Phycisphaerales bacterium]